MTLRNAQSMNDTVAATRDRLLRRRTRMERGWRRNCWEEGGCPQPKSSLRVEATRALLKLAGVYNRGVRNANDASLREVTFSFPALPAAFDGFRILHLSDFHYGWDLDLADRLCRLVRGVDADLGVLTGDFRFNHHAPCWRVFGGLRKLTGAVAPRHGFAAVLGNNDMSDLAAGMQSAGIRVLFNEHFEIRHGDESLWVAGVDDPHEFQCDSVDCAVAGIPEGAFTVLLAHSPEIAEEAAARGIDLYLCGHTHGGQICLPWIGLLMKNARCPRRYAAGGEWRYGAMQGFTTKGIGTSTLPVRYNCPPEAVLLTLRRG